MHFWRSSGIAFAVSAMMGSFFQTGRRRISRVAASPSITGIMTSMSTRSTDSDGLFSTRSSRSSASRPLRAMSSFAPFGSRMLERAKMFRASSSTTRMLRPSKADSRWRTRRRMRWCSGGSVVSTWCRKSDTSSSRRSGERAPLMMTELA